MILEELSHILAKSIEGSSFEGKTYFVGGCVRDWVLNATLDIVADVDLCVESAKGGIALAQYLQPQLTDSKLSTNPQFGTAKLAWRKLILEFVATRKEIYTQGSRFPKVFPGTLLDDVLRRDFTINALLLNVSTGELSDLCGKGLSDLHQGIIRCIGEPQRRFKEDPLRLLRAVRFALCLGYRIEPETFRAMQNERTAISRLSATQISKETAKLKHLPHAEVAAMLKTLGWGLTF